MLATKNGMMGGKEGFYAQNIIEMWIEHEAEEQSQIDWRDEQSK